MARGAAQTRRKRTKADARRRRRRAQASTPAPIASQTMFFPRLRRSAKWVFVFLAVVFAVGFVVFGVGSGNFGLGDIFRNNNNTTQSSVSATAARKRIQQNPNDVQAYRDLAEALQTNGDLEGAIGALRHVTRLRPHDVDALTALAGLYSSVGARLQPQIQAAQTAGQAGALTAAFNSGIQLKGQTVVPPDPIFQAASGATVNRLNDLYSRQQTAYSAAEASYKSIAALQPRDAPTQLNLGGAASQAGDTAGAIAAYRRFLRLAPDDPTVPAVKQQIKALRQSARTPTAATGG
jgi:cytochrome c-type biogenesis protein CcmH/NrfG